MKLKCTCDLCGTNINIDKANEVRFFMLSLEEVNIDTINYKVRRKSKKIISAKFLCESCQRLFEIE